MPLALGAAADVRSRGEEPCCRPRVRRRLCSQGPPSSDRLPGRNRRWEMLCPAPRGGGRVGSCVVPKKCFLFPLCYHKSPSARSLGSPWTSGHFTT